MPQQQYSAEQWQALIDQQAASGQTMVAFCAEHGLARSTFQRWKRRLQTDTSRPLSQPSAQPTFMPLLDSQATSTSMPTPAAAQAWDIELDLGHGLQLRIRRQP